MNFDVYDFNKLALKFRNGACIEQCLSDPYYDVMAALTAQQFLESRVMPSRRWGIELAEYFGIQDWSPIEICRKTHGYKMLEPTWIKFPEDPDTLTYEEVTEQIW